MEGIQKVCLPSTLPDQPTKMTPGVRGEKEALATWDLNLCYRCVANTSESLCFVPDVHLPRGKYVNAIT